MKKKDYNYNNTLTDISFYILASVIKEQHGYLIMKNIEKFTDNEIIIGPASLYTTLKKLLDYELIKLQCDLNKNRKIYKITDKGIEILNNEINRKKQMISYAEKNLELKKGEDYEI